LLIFEDCKLFRDIAHAKSLSRAAQINGISQSAATQHIQELERRLGTSLLDRSTRPLGLTDAGKLYADLCRDILRREEDFTAALEEIRGSSQGTLRIASIYSLGLSEMVRLKKEFAHVCPGAIVHVELLRPDKVYDAVLGGSADLGFISYPEHRRDLTVIPWRDERMTVALYPSHPLAGRSSVRPRDIEGQNFVAFDEEVIIRRELDRFFRENDISVSTVMQFDNIQSIKEAVALGTGISILPETAMQAEVAQRRLVSLPLQGIDLLRPVALIHRRKKKLNMAALEFVRLVTGRKTMETRPL
jgi:DNA-binding transcriptional LysR family regulator